MPKTNAETHLVYKMISLQKSVRCWLMRSDVNMMHDVYNVKLGGLFKNIKGKFGCIQYVEIFDQLKK